MASPPSDWSADQQAALRRVATLVASGPSPEDVFAAVTAEIGRVLDVDVTVMGRYDSDGAATVLGTWTRTGAPVPLPVDGRAKLGGRKCDHAGVRDRSAGAFGQLRRCFRPGR
jgi:hypothetical protein